MPVVQQAYLAEQVTSLSQLCDIYTSPVSGQSSPIRIIHTTPTKVEPGGELKQDIVQFYKNTGLESAAREVGTV